MLFVGKPDPILRLGLFVICQATFKNRYDNPPDYSIWVNKGVSSCILQSKAGNLKVDEREIEMLEARKELERRRFWIVNEIWESTPPPSTERALELYSEWYAIETQLVRMGE